MLLSISALKSFRLCVTDVAQAYTQSSSGISREIYLKPPKELREKYQGRMFRLLKPLYGLTDAGSYWFSPYLKCFQDIGLQQSFADVCFLFRSREAKSETHATRHEISYQTLNGIAAVLVDDTLSAGTNKIDWTYKGPTKHSISSNARRVTF
jgi:hypothetical protein